MKKKIYDLKDLEIARLEARLKAAESLRLAKEAGTEIKHDFNSLSSVGKTVGKFIRSSGRREVKHDSGFLADSFDNRGLPWDELGLDLFFQIREKGVKWQSIILPIGIWLIKNGYFDQLIKTKKSDIYAGLLRVVRMARNSKNK